jgi:pyruvate/2-oxoglutarate dehydrogenase complex dihydrolipoamide dehydrogenase (E3) component
MALIETDICIIGAGSGGLVVAAGAAQMGAQVVLIEKHRMGGDCLNYGCVPSKALLAAAHAAQAQRDAGRFGIGAVAAPDVDWNAVIDHVEDVIAGIAPHDSVARFEGLGVQVIEAEARFVGRREVVASGDTVRAKYIVIATGSRATAPPIAGLDAVPYFTNESIFANRERPDHLIVIGGGPIGMELAQAHRRLGCDVTVLEAFTALAKDPPDMAQVVKDRLRDEGVDLREGVEIARIDKADAGIRVEFVDGGALTGSHLLVAAGRAPVLDGLDLEKAGIRIDGKGLDVDARLRTSNRRVYAVGDAAGAAQFTHLAAYHAGIVIRNALFKLPAKADYSALPWVTYTDPELAHVGATEAEARKRLGDSLRIVEFPYAENDRARTERAAEGRVRAYLTKRGRILGADIVGRQAGELIHVWAFAIANGMKISAFNAMIAPYPTLGEISRRAAGEFYTPSLFSDRTRKLVRFLMRVS